MDFSLLTLLPFYFLLLCGIPISLTLFSLSIVSIITIVIIKKLLSKYIYLVKKYNYDTLLIKNNDNVPSTSLSKKTKEYTKNNFDLFFHILNNFNSIMYNKCKRFCILS